MNRRFEPVFVLGPMSAIMSWENVNAPGTADTARELAETYVGGSDVTDHTAVLLRLGGCAARG